ncbi:MAG: flavin reductase family protein [Verrucomicrobia bacterium]|nr:flavin reductase family protein [Verrucomicrobiota bacterium]
MHFDLAAGSLRDTYNLMIGLVAPRPIAWITSLDLDGRLNAAPFSAYNYLGVDPPIVAIGVANRPGKQIVGKDTARNIRHRGEFVINVVNESLGEAMNLTAIDFPPEINELEIAKLETVPSEKVSVPRIAAAPAALECREHATLEIGRSRVILGVVVSIFVRDELIDPAGPYVRATELHSIGRMNGLSTYTRTRDLFQMERQDFAQWQTKNAKKEL